ncbi:uncharacterized protein [Clytia hemisphaerica]|uniref:uncharacterized protein n=1 Tax=Clytia hemisphaerica TaxID=252671 RepID=UPI0034D6B920
MKSIHPRDEAPLCNIDVVRHSDHFNSISIIETPSFNQGNNEDIRMNFHNQGLVKTETREADVKPNLDDLTFEQGTSETVWQKITRVKKSRFYKREHQNKIVNGNKHEVVVISDSESENELPTSNRYSALSNEEVFNPIGQVTDSDSYVTDDSFNFKPFTAQQSKSIDHEAVILINSDSDEQSFQDDIGPALHSPAVIDNVGECIEVISSGRQQKKIPRTIWADEPEQIVEEIPLDIDGLQVYRVIASERSEFSAKLKDGRHWKKDSRTEWAGFKSVRYRDCLGGYSCPNTDCFYFLEFKHPNRNRFKRKNICEYCEGIGDYTPCSARKYTAFRSDSEAYVYHIGLHTCYAMLNNNITDQLPSSRKRFKETQT